MAFIKCFSTDIYSAHFKLKSFFGWETDGGCDNWCSFFFFIIIFFSWWNSLVATIFDGVSSFIYPIRFCFMGNPEMVTRFGLPIKEHIASAWKFTFNLALATLDLCYFRKSYQMFSIRRIILNAVSAGCICIALGLLCMTKIFIRAFVELYIATAGSSMLLARSYCKSYDLELIL